MGIHLIQNQYPVYAVVRFYIRSENTVWFWSTFYANKIGKERISTTYILSKMHQIIKEAEF